MSKKDDERNDEQPKNPGRRAFLGQASCAAVGTTALYSTVLNMGMFNAMAGVAGPGDYKGLVCLFLSGGADSFNMIVPRGDAEYAEYANIRRDLALPQTDLLPVTPQTSDGREYGFHPGMVELQGLFEQGNLAVVNNVGTLVAPMTLDEFRNGQVRPPLGLFSHSDQQMHWQSSLPDQRSTVGWAGRMSDILGSLNTSDNISMNISLSGTNIFQSGTVTNIYTIGANGSQGIRDYDGTSESAIIRTNAIDGLLGMTYQNLFERTFAVRMAGAIRAHVDFSAAIEAVPPFQTVFSDTNISRRFEMIARTIAAREALGMRRQTFFLDAGGWDHHDELITQQDAMLPQISAALSEFQAALTEIGIQDDVVTFTASDFARTLTSNGRGSDHAWGGNCLVMGGAVRGGEFYGAYPELYEGNDRDTGRGRLIPTMGVDEYFAELALWFGIARPDLELVLPNVARFYDPLSNAAPVGFVANAGPGPAQIVDPLAPSESLVRGGKRAGRG